MMKMSVLVVTIAIIMIGSVTLTSAEKGDDKKYCEGKGEWKDGECKIDNEEDRTAYEDAVCDNAREVEFEEICN